MKRMLLTAALAGLWLLPGQAQDSVTVELELEDINEASAAIEAVTKTAEPIVKQFEEGVDELNRLAADVAKNRNALTAAKFENAMAGRIGGIVEGMDDLLNHKQEITWACEDIEYKVKRLGKRLGQKQIEIKEKIDRQKITLTSYKEDLKDLQAELRRARGEDEKKEVLRQMNRMSRKLKQELTKYKMRRNLYRIQVSTLATLGSRGSTLSNLGEDVTDFFDDLLANRATLTEIASLRTDVLQVSEIIDFGQLGAHFKGFQRISENLGRLSSAMDKLSDLPTGLEDGEISVMEGSDQNVEERATGLLDSLEDLGI